MFYCILTSECCGYNIVGRILFGVVRQRQPGYVAIIGTIRIIYGGTLVHTYRRV